MMPLRCGRLDCHHPHDWPGTRWPQERGVGPSSPRPVLYHCGGETTVEGGYWADWDAEDDEAEEQAIRDAREIA